MSNEFLRLFVALTLESPARREIVRLQKKMWGEGAKGLTRPENLHLTLAFLGETEPKRIDDICWAMDKVHMPPPELIFDRIGMFKQSGGDVWWLGMGENKALDQFQDCLADNLIYKGFKLEERKFVPHLTLARRSEPNYMPKNARLERPIRSHVLYVSLMCSEQIDGRRVYSELYRTA